MLALDAQDLEPVEPAIERDARTHGKVRWQQGYRIDETSTRTGSVQGRCLWMRPRTFAGSNDAFTRRHEALARRLIDDALGFVTVTSIREVVTERGPEN